VVEQGTHKPLLPSAVLSEWDLIGNLLSYGLYLGRGQEHITPIEHIPDVLVSEWQRKSCRRRRIGQTDAQVH
jgi:hypothetical protein